MGPRTEGSQPPSCRGREGGCRDGLVASKSRESWGLTSVGRAESACQILSLQSLLGLPGPPCAGRSEDGAVQGAESAERAEPGPAQPLHHRGRQDRGPPPAHGAGSHLSELYIKSHLPFTG